MGSHSTQVQNSSRKLHTIHILVLVHNAMYMAHTCLRFVFNFSSFPPRRNKLEDWLMFKLTISTANLHNTILDDRSSVHQSVGTLLSALLKYQIKTHRNI